MIDVVLKILILELIIFLGSRLFISAQLSKNKKVNRKSLLLEAAVFFIFVLLLEDMSTSYEVSANNVTNENQAEDNLEDYLFSLPDYPYKNKRKANKLMKTYKKAMKADIEDFVYLEEISKGGFFTEKEVHYKKTIDKSKAVYKYYGKLNKKSEPDGKGLLLEVWNDELYNLEDLDYPKYMVAVYYIGGFDNGFKDGYGIEYNNLSKEYKFIVQYEGNFKKGKYSGKGIDYSYSDSKADEVIGDKLLTLLHDAQASDSTYDKIFPYYKGNKLITYPIMLSRKHYEGNYKDGLYSGKGKIFSQSWDYVSQVGYDYIMYDGKFKNGKYEGKGTLYFDQGVVEYKGEFKNGKYHGKGVLYDENGKVLHKGKFKNGEIE